MHKNQWFNGLIAMVGPGTVQKDHPAFKEKYRL